MTVMGEDAGNLVSLDGEETDLLRFILDATIEHWGSEQEGQLRNICRDPAFTSWEQMLETSQLLARLPGLAQRIRKKLDR